MTDEDNLIVAERRDGTEEKEWEVVDHNGRRRFLRAHRSQFISPSRSGYRCHVTSFPYISTRCFCCAKYRTLNVFALYLTHFSAFGSAWTILIAMGAASPNMFMLDVRTDSKSVLPYALEVTTATAHLIGAAS
jgi:hypothetical protein